MIVKLSALNYLVIHWCDFVFVAHAEIVPSSNTPPPPSALTAADGSTTASTAAANDLTNGTSAAAASGALKRGYEQTNGIDGAPASKRANHSSGGSVTGSGGGMSVIKQNLTAAGGAVSKTSQVSELKSSQGIV